MGCSLRVQKLVLGSEESRLNLTLTRAFGEGFTSLYVCHGLYWMQYGDAHETRVSGGCPESVD